MLQNLHGHYANQHDQHVNLHEHYANPYENHYIMECARYNPFIVPILPTILEIQAHSTKFTQIPPPSHQQAQMDLYPAHSIIKLSFFTPL
jgi:hypothetical protein